MIYSIILKHLQYTLTTVWPSSLYISLYVALREKVWTPLIQTDYVSLRFS